MVALRQKTIALHIFSASASHPNGSVCSLCGHGPGHSPHYHEFTPTRIKSICATCGYGTDSMQHAVVIQDGSDSRDLSVRLAAELENRNHDAEVILKFQRWISRLGTGSIDKTDLLKLIDRYAQNIKLGHEK